MNRMATHEPDEPDDPPGRYVRRPIDGHGVVRAVWVRDAGTLVGSPVRVVARTFPSVVLHLDGAADVEVRAAGSCSTGALTRRALGFDAYPWASPDQVAALERAVRCAPEGDPPAALALAVLERCDAPVRSDVVSDLATALEAAPDRATMQAVLDRTSTSPRTLRRRFAVAVGMSADRYRVIARATLARHALVTTSSPLATLAHELGYADQSHLHRDVLELSGWTPTEWRERRRAWKLS